MCRLVPPERPYCKILKARVNRGPLISLSLLIDVPLSVYNPVSEPVGVCERVVRVRKDSLLTNAHRYTNIHAFIQPEIDFNGNL